MKLIRGSYAYIVGLFILGASSVISVVAFFFSLFSRGKGTNDLLSPFGGRIAGSIVTIVLSAFMTVALFWFSIYVLWNALKNNSLVKPMTVIAAGLFIYAPVTVFTSFFFAPENEGSCYIVLRAGKAVFPLLLAVCVLIGLRGKHRMKAPMIVLCALCALQSFFGYGFWRVFRSGGTAETSAVLSYISLLLFATSLFLFFVGLCFFIGGSSFETRKQDH